MDANSFSIFSVLSESEIQALCVIQAKAYFFADHFDRFENHSEDDPRDSKFEGGTMTWHETAGDMLLYLAHERSAGHSAIYLWDLEKATDASGAYVVLSSRKLS